MYLMCVLNRKTLPKSTVKHKIIEVFLGLLINYIENNDLKICFTVML